MSCGQSSPEVQVHLVAVSTTDAFAPALDGMAPGPGEARSVVDETAGKPAPESAWGWMCDCLAPVSDLAPVGEPCGDGGMGEVRSVSEWVAQPGGDLCVASIRCSGGSVCGCHKKATEFQLGGGAAECGAQGLMTDADVQCWYSPSVGQCKCNVQCANGSWVETIASRGSGNGHPVCAEGEREDSNVPLTMPACERAVDYPELGGPVGCTIRVGATPVSRAGFHLGWHLFVVHYSDANIGTIFGGQPDDDRTSGCPAFGHIRVDSKGTFGVPYWSVSVLTGRDACDKRSCLKDEANRINSERVCYGLPSPNSNSVAYTLLTKCGIPASKPMVDTPGWGVLV